MTHEKTLTGQRNDRTLSKPNKMKIREINATLSGDKTEHEMPKDGLEIISDDGMTLFSIRFDGLNGILVSASGVIKHEGVMLDDSIRIKPNASNQVVIYRPKYK